MASKLGGHSLIRDHPLRKVGGPLTPRTPRIAATAHAQLIHGRESTSAYPKLYIDRFICFGTAHGSVQQRDAYTDHGTSVTIGRIFTLCACNAAL